MECNLPEEEFEIICKKWAKNMPYSERNKEFNYVNDVGKNICYLSFLEELEKGMDPVEPRELESNRNMTKKPPSSPFQHRDETDHTEIEKVMMKIKIKAKTERIRVIDFMLDFDHLRRGKISQNEFRRAVKVLFPDLQEVFVFNLA